MFNLFKKYVEVELDIEKDVLFKLMLMAHEQNITLNKLCENILKEQMKKMKEDKNYLETILESDKQISISSQREEDNLSFSQRQKDNSNKYPTSYIPIEPIDIKNPPILKRKNKVKK
jgi:hypothetical protein